MMVKIDKTPPPKKRHSYASFFEKVQVGDSFACDLKMKNAAQRYFNRHGWECVTKKIEDDQWRVWRI